jgi:alcohol dehydrogenase
MIDNDPSRLSAAKEMGATMGCSSAEAVAMVQKATDGVGCDVVIEAVGIPATFELCQDLVALGGNIANIGVHGKEAVIHLEKLWGYNLTMTMGFVNTTSTPTLMKMFEKGTLGLGQLITHGEFLSSWHGGERGGWDLRMLADLIHAEFNLQKEGEDAYRTFSSAAQHKALKMIITTD